MAEYRYTEFGTSIEAERPPERCPTRDGGQCCVAVERGEKRKRGEKER